MDDHIHGCRSHGGIRCLGGRRCVQALGDVRIHLHAALFGFCHTAHLDLGIVVAVRHRHSSHDLGGTAPQRTGPDHGIGTIDHGRRGVGLHLQGFLLVAVTIRGILAGGLHRAVDLDVGLVVHLGIAHPCSWNLAGNLLEIFLAGSHRASGTVQVGLSLCLHRISGDRSILPDGDTGFVFEQHHIGAHRHHIADGIPQFIRNRSAAIHIGIVGAGLHLHGALGRHIALHVHSGHGLSIAAGIAGIRFLPFLEIAVGGLGGQCGVPGSRHGTIVLHAGRDGLGDIDVRAAQKPGGVHQVIEGLVQAVDRVGPGGQDHVPIAVLRGGQRGQSDVFLLFGAQIHQPREIRDARVDGRALFDATGGRTIDGFSGQVLAHGHLAGIELHVIGSVDLAQHADGAAGVDPDVGSAVLDAFQLRILIGTGSKVTLQDFIGSLILILKVLGPGRSHDIEGPRVDNAALADDHAAGTQEEQVAADFSVLDGVQRAVDVDAGIDKVQKILGVDRPALDMEVQIGDMVGVQLEFLELIDGILVVDFLGVDIVDAFLRRCIYRLFIGVCDI
nr:hypothetical protein [Mitsuokella multacida]